MIYGYGSDIFPVLSTKHISLDNFSDRNNPKIKVTFCLTTLEEAGVPSWFQNNEISDLTHIYFMVLDDNTRDLISSISRDDTRTSLIADIITNNIFQMRSSGAFHSVSLRDLLLTRDLSQVESSQMPGLYRSQMQAEVSIPYSPLSDPELLDTENLHLVSFLHMRVDENGNQGQLGGNLVYDHLCYIDESGILRTRQYRNTFYIKETSSELIEDENGLRRGPVRSILRPYSGPAHYHGDDNPAPDGYVGWMAGHADGEMGPKLEVRTVLNYKVSLGIMYRLGRENPAMNLPIIENNIVSNHERFVSLTDIRTLEEDSEKIKKIIEKNILSSQTGQPNIIDYGTRDTLHIRIRTGRNSDLQMIEKSHYGCVIGIDFLKVCMFNSQFGRLLQFHNNAGNDEFVHRCIYHSNILKIEILRKRLKNTPEHMNKVSSLKYTKYNKNNPDQFLVSSSDRKPLENPPFAITNASLKYRLRRSIFERASIEEVDLFSMVGNTPVPGPRYSRQFVVRDYDLFHNVNCGKYTYTVKLTMKDGIKKVIEQILNQAIENNLQFLKYFQQAQIPLIGEGTNLQTGNYNHRTLDFTPEFRARQDFENVINNCVNSFAELKNLILGETVDQQIVEDLYVMLSPAATSFETLEYFKHIMSKLINSAQRIFSNFNIIKNYDSSKSNAKSNPANAGGFLRDSYNLKTETGIVADSFSSTTLLADFERPSPFGHIMSILDFNDNIYLLPDTQTNFPDVSSLADVRNLPLIEPDRFISAPDSFFPIESDFSLPSEWDILDLEEEDRTPPSQRFGFMAEQQYTRLPFTVQSPIVEISTKNDFNNMNMIQRNNLELKINLLRDFNSLNTGIINKEPAFFELMSKKKFGISLFTSETSINNLGLIDDNQIFNWLENIIPDSTRDFRISIYESAYKGKDKKHFFEMNEEIYKTLTTSREHLGNIYDHLQNLILSNTITSYITQTTMNQKDKYLGIPSRALNNTVEKYTNCYKREESAINVLCPGIPKIAYNPAPFTRVKISTRDRKSFIFAKLDQTKEKKDAIMPVNNGYFLEI